MSEHSALTGSSLHEPKGAASAASGAVYVANGAGSGTWTKLNNKNYLVLTVGVADINTAGDTYVACPIAGKIAAAYCAVGAGTTVADTVVTLKIGGTAVTGGSMTISHTGTGAAAGDVISATPTAANTLTAGQAIDINSDGAGSSTVPVVFTLLIDVS